MNILTELKRKALDAKCALDAVDSTFSDWQGLLSDSENITKALTLDLLESNKMFLRSIINISTTDLLFLTHWSTDNNQVASQYYKIIDD